MFYRRKRLSSLSSVLLACILLLAVFTLLVGCVPSAPTPTAAPSAPTAAPAARTGGKYTIGVTLLSLQYPFLVTVGESMKDEASKLGVNLISLDPRQKTDTELSQIENLITQKVNLIIMIPVDVDGSIAAAKKVNQAGIPLILLNTKLSPSFQAEGGKFVTYVGSDDVAAGRIEGTFLVKELNGRGNVIYLVGQYGGASTNLRKQGFTEVIRDYPGIKIVTELEAHGSRAEAKTIMENLLTKYKPNEVQAVVTQSDEMALGALSAIQAAGRQSEFKVIMGVDATPDAVKSFREGGINATVFQDADAQGREAVRTALKVLNGEKVPPIVDIPFKLVWKDTIDKIFPK
ncbi:MAG: sugar ABC transporter substrate-binding protein [Chloroflexi bacterium]|nr:sugar ABC transporter substrate-binding protein [Chloroflexota bacterium]MCL5074773.1 sugar ABC transporter substrate-binding protein [Chloroflexota bacterium]